MDRNPIRQLIVAAQEADLELDANGQRWATGAAGRWRVLGPRQHYEGWDLSLRTGEQASGPSVSVIWLGGRPAQSAADVMGTFADAFSFQEEDLDRDRHGLRTPQSGAVHAVIGYWTTKSTQPATVVMPTGTGKTETMVALLVAAEVPCLLVIVPSDALRSQIAAKFERFGVLQQFGVISAQAARPVVGQIRHGFSSVDTAKAFAEACNVIVATPNALNASSPEVRSTLMGACSHLFVDEAHHVAATTWKDIRDQCDAKPIVQFTATPFRVDGRQLGGRLIYAFPLREAQAQGYFSHINYVSVLDLGDVDRAVAARAIDQLRTDLAAGYDHLLMARVNRVGRAEDDVLPIYQELAPDLAPVILHSTLTQHERRQALEAIHGRNSRIIICVDMLGEGFDLPFLKVAAVHDAHKSLGVTLQFVGRFARVATNVVGDATAVIGRPDPDYDVNLRRLYAEDADWNLVIRDLSEIAVSEQQEISDFEAAFGALPDEVALRNLEPKMSTVVYTTHRESWQPEAVTDVFPEEKLLTFPIAVNQRDAVAWFVTQNVQPVRWGDLRTVEEVSHDLYVLYWDEDRQLLYVNSSNNKSVHQAVARAVCGEDADRITGEVVYRAMGAIDRLVPTNVGVLDVRNRSRRFSLHVGADVSEGFPLAEAQTKTQTNIFANGYEEGARVSIGASLKGRIWSFRVANTLKEWMDWCDHIGGKLIDTGISVDEVMLGFIRPQAVEDRPEYVPLALEWPWPVYGLSEELKLSFGGELWPLIDSDLMLTSQAVAGPIEFAVQTPDWSAPYAINISGGNVSYVAQNVDVLVTNRRETVTLSAFLERSSLTVIFENDVMLVQGGMLLRPDRTIPPFDPDRLQVVDWQGIDLSKEAQGAQRDPTAIQARAIQHLRGLASWDLIIDDDGKGEIADIIAMRVDSHELVILLLHCKASSQPSPGARIADLYEVCGQAQKSARRTGDIRLLFRHLIRRERRRQERGRSGIDEGTPPKLYELEDRSRLLRPRFTIGIVQPGMSKAVVSDSQLELLACTEVYLRETANADFEVICNG